MSEVKYNFKQIIKDCTELANNQGFEFDWEQAPTYLLLITSEVCEAMEAWRDNDKEHFKEEIVDVLIRVFHLVGQLKLENIEGKLVWKMNKNKKRGYHHGRKKL